MDIFKSHLQDPEYVYSTFSYISVKVNNMDMVWNIR